MIDNIDIHIRELLKIRDSDYVKNYPQLRGSICKVIEKAYFLESLILEKKQIIETNETQFFTAKEAVNRHFRDWNLDNVADIYNHIREISKPYIS